MSKFKKKPKADPGVSTASLPDIVFMLLFFFMVTTVLREQDLLVEQRLPQMTQLQKLEKKTLISYLFVGKPKNTSLYGTEPRIQANDVLIGTKDILLWVNQEKDKLSEAERDQITISMKADREVKMGPISDIQFELREADARKLMYASTGKVEN
ncbi:ExbD/TolR family protein [Aquiflexum sp.]|uniref:ExbD/TolR family protein n=1 Tax=Aquiflexum sp. TaxID=1872584 RepID=UPI0035936385